MQFFKYRMSGVVCDFTLGDAGWCDVGASGSGLGRPVVFTGVVTISVTMFLYTSYSGNGNGQLTGTGGSPTKACERCLSSVHERGELSVGRLAKRLGR